MIARGQARRIVEALDTGDLARSAWRAASRRGEDGAEVSAAIGLDLTTGELVTATWFACAEPPRHDGPILVLASCSTSEREQHTERLSAGFAAPPSEEVIEEEMVRAAGTQGVSMSGLEEQLDAAYGVERR